jgi:WD40 repeat protein
MKNIFRIIPLVIISSLIIGSCKNSIVESDANAIKLNPPTDMSLELSQNMQIKIIWSNKSTGAYQTILEKQIGTGGSWSAFGWCGAGVISFVDSAQKFPDSVNSYRARTFYKDSYSDYSSVSSIIISLPSPTNLQLVSSTDFAITMRWQDNSHTEKGYFIDRKAGIGSWTLIATTDSNTTSYADSSFLSDSVDYSYKVRPFILGVGGVNVAGGQSNILIARPPIFATPSNLVMNSFSDSGAVLQWKDNTASERKFLIERNTGGSFQVIDSVGENITSYKDKGPIIGDTKYYYRVRAVSNWRNSDYSNVDSGKITFAPSQMHATGISEIGISLSWTDNCSFETGFQLERKGGTNPDFSLLVTLPSTATSFTDSATKMVDGDLFTYRVRATSKNNGNSSYSNNDSTQFAFPRPTSLTMQHLSDNAFKIIWNDNSVSEDGFYIELQNLSTNKIDTVKASNGITSYTFNNIDNHYNYQIQGKAYRSKAESKYTPSIRAGISIVDINKIQTFTDTSSILTVSVDTSGNYIAAGGMNGIIRYWNKNTNSSAIALIPDTLSSVRGCAINLQNDKIVACYDDGTIRLWKLSDGSLIWKKSTGSSALAAAWNPTGSSIVTGQVNQTMRVLDAASGNLLRILAGHTSAVKSVQFSNSGSYIVSSSADQSIKIWNAASGSETKSFANAHTGSVNSCSFITPTDTLLASVGDDGLVKLWQSNLNNNILIIGSHLQGATSIISPTFNNIITAGDDGSLKLWRNKDGNLLKSAFPHSSSITSLSFSNNKTTFAAGSLDKTLSVWNITLGWVLL